MLAMHWGVNKLEGHEFAKGSERGTPTQKTTFRQAQQGRDKSGAGIRLDPSDMQARDEFRVIRT